MIVAVKWKQFFNDRHGRQDMYVATKIPETEFGPINSWCTYDN